MSSATALAASLLAGAEITDDHFYIATALLITRLEPSKASGDVRVDPEAPKVLFDWFRHARARCNDMRVWSANCAIHQFFEPDRGAYLPGDWAWDTRDLLLEASDYLCERFEWLPVLEQAIARPTTETIGALACCGAKELGVDTYELLWRYLTEHVDDATGWQLLGERLKVTDLAELMSLARSTLVRPEELTPARVMKKDEALWHVWVQVMQLLRRFPGEGVDLIERALLSPELSVRRSAIEVLALHWGVDRMPPDTTNLIIELMGGETDSVVLRGFEALLHRA